MINSTSIENHKFPNTKSLLLHHQNSLDGDVEEEDTEHPHWMKNVLSTTSQNDRNENQVLKFQSKDHRNSSNYFALDEFCGDFKNNKLCPGSELNYQRYFTSHLKLNNNNNSISDNVDNLKSNHLNQLGIRENSSRHHTPKHIKRHRDIEVIILPPGTRKLFQIKVFIIISYQLFYFIL